MQITDLKENDLAESFAYEVDDFNTICRSGRSSDRIDLHNALDCIPLFKSFDAIFTDDKTRSVFNKVLRHTRTTKEVVSFPYRCDTERMCHFYRLTVSISSARHVLFYNKLLGSDSRQNGVYWKRIWGLTSNTVNAGVKARLSAAELFKVSGGSLATT